MPAQPIMRQGLLQQPLRFEQVPIPQAPGLFDTGFTKLPEFSYPPPYGRSRPPHLRCPVVEVSRQKVGC